MVSAVSNRSRSVPGNPGAIVRSAMKCSGRVRRVSSAPRATSRSRSSSGSRLDEKVAVGVQEGVFVGQDPAGVDAGQVDGHDEVRARVGLGAGAQARPLVQPAVGEGPGAE